MKTHSAVILGLAIGIALSALAQEQNTVDQRIAQQRDLLGDAKAVGDFSVLRMKEDEAFNNNNAAALAALFTDDGVLVSPNGMISGRKDIEKRYAETFQHRPFTTFCSQIGHQLNAIDNAVWSAGEWWSSFQGQNGPKFETGSWSAIYVREGNVWKIRLLTLSERPQSAAVADTN